MRALGIVAIFVAGAFLAWGCGSSPANRFDASASDAGSATASDAGGSSIDTGPDTGATADASADAGPVRVDQPAIECADTVGDVYVPPGSLPAMTNATRGDVVRCAPDSTLAVSDVQTAIAGAGDTGVTATSGVNLFRVAYRTYRGNGSAGMSSARVYLPTTPHESPLPVIVIGHGTAGMGANVTPSKDSSTLKDLALPWAAIGYAVIAPDYAGLGTPGVQGYVDNHDTAYSILDAARALRKMLPAGAFSSKVAMAGHSQGGGGILSAQALAKTYGLDGDLVAVAAFAPEWPSRLNSFGYVSMLKSPDDLTISTGISNCVVAAYREYAYFSNYVPSSNGEDAFPSTQADTEASMMSSLDQTGFGGYLQGVDLHIGDMFDSTFRASLLACIAGGAAGCNAREAAYLTFLQQNILTADPTGAKVLYVQGLLDPVMTPAEEGACNVQKLQNDGVTPTVCVDATAVHTNVTPRNIAYGISWVQAVLSGNPVPACSSSASLPSCNP